jgi:hypothetical protein
MSFSKRRRARRQDLIGVSLFGAFPGNPDNPEDTGNLLGYACTGMPLAMERQDFLHIGQATRYDYTTARTVRSFGRYPQLRSLMDKVEIRNFTETSFPSRNSYFS